MSNQPLIIAHRGASRESPENTLAAFDLAINHYKAKMIEFDIHLSNDHVPMIIHDPCLERTTNGQGLVSQMSCEELQKLDAGYFFNPKNDKSFPGRNKSINIPRLEELLECFPNTQLAIEIKDKNPKIVHKTMSLLSRYSKEEDSIIGSKYANIENEIKTHYPNMRHFCSRRSILFMIASHKFIPRIKGPKKSAVASTPPTSPLFTFETESWIRYLHNRGMKAFFWTINNAEQIKKLADFGADGIITDDLRMAMSAIKC